MIKNYFKTAWRSLRKNRGFSLLNICGLAIGIACAGLIFLWVENEWQYDSVHKKRDHVYAIRVNQDYDAGVFTHWSTPGLLAPAIRSDVPGIVSTCRKSEGTMAKLFTVGDKAVYANGSFAEPSFFSMFSFTFLQGNPKDPFNQPYSLIITESARKKFFGNEENVVGKTVRMDKKQDYVIAGVITDPPQNSSLQFGWIAPFEIYYRENKYLHEWGNFGLTTYVELQPGASAAPVNAQLKDYMRRVDPKSISHFFLFPLKDWHLYDDFENGKQTGEGQITYVRLFMIIGIIILLIACINFMNLATARSEKRAREVGVRKVLGANRKSLIFQFFGEALLISCMSAAVAVAIMLFALPAFNGLVQKQMSLHLFEPLHIGFLATIVITCGLVAGSYPSLYLSSFNPGYVLKGIKLKTGSAALVRKSLVVAQFALSVIFITATIIVYQQIQHVKHRDLGFNKDNLIELQAQGDMAPHFSAIKQDLINTGMVENAALTDHETIYGGNNTDGLRWQGKDPSVKLLVSFRNVSPGYLQVTGLKIQSGRDFRATDKIDYAKGFNSPNVIITESLEKQMGGGSAIGKYIYNGEDTTGKAEVVGVVNDFVYGNLYGQPDPVVFVCVESNYATMMYVRIRPGVNTARMLTAMENVLKKHNPGYPFQYRFVDDQFNQLFLTEELVSKLSGIFAALAIFISCLGLVGLAAYMAERRTREVGIRKLLGASAFSLWTLLSKEFLWLIIIACLIATPVALWLMSDWLQKFEYRINLSVWMFLVSGFLAIIIALLTISFQAIKAAIANPVKSLRTE